MIDLFEELARLSEKVTLKYDKEIGRYAIVYCNLIIYYGSCAGTRGERFLITTEKDVCMAFSTIDNLKKVLVCLIAEEALTKTEGE